MYLLDTDHMSVLRRGGAESLRLQMRLSTLPDDKIVTCIVVYEEQMRGWLAEAAHIQSGTQLIAPYNSLASNLAVFCAITVLPFDAPAARYFDEFKRQKIRIGTQDENRCYCARP